MKLIDLNCSKCGAQLKVNADLKKCMCQYCGNEMLIDDEVIHHQIDNGQDFGYQAQLGKQQAQARNELELARREMLMGNLTGASEHYKVLESIDIKNIEAIYYNKFIPFLANINNNNFNYLIKALDMCKLQISTDNIVEVYD